MIRLALGQAAPGGWDELPQALVDGGPLDYLLLRSGRECRKVVESLSGQLRSRGIRLVCGVDGCTPLQLAEQVRESKSGLRIGVISGDILDQEAGRLAEQGVPLPESVISIRAIFGAIPVAEALASGADVVLAGEYEPESLVLGAALQRLGWRRDDMSRIAAASLAGRILGSGTTACGGGAQADWQTVRDPASMDAPIAEINEGGDFVITKHPGSGGGVSLPNVLEALLNGVGNPRAVPTPDCLLDISEVEVTEAGQDRVRVRGAKGSSHQLGFARVTWHAGWRATGELVYTRPAALEKAYAADRILREKAARLGLRLDDIHTDFAGAGTSLIPAAILDASVPEVLLRVAARGTNKIDVDRFAHLIAPLAAWGPPGGCCPPGTGDPRVEGLICVRTVAIPAGFLRPRVEVIG